MEGFFRRIWGPKGIDKIAQTSRGIFIVRFHIIQNRDKVIEEGIQMFDRKPVIIKAWKSGIEMSKIMVDKVPIWIRLPNLDLKYWGKAALTKIAGLVGKPIKADSATTTKEKLMFAR